MNIARLSPIIFLILVNLLPVMGVLLWGWDLGALLILYWLESLVVGFFNFIKILQARKDGKSKLFTAGFFAVHYGGFWFGHGIFLVAVLLPMIDQANPASDLPFNSMLATNLKGVFFALLASHGFSYVMDFARTPKASRRPATVQMFTPYGRVFVMHIVILLGAYFMTEQAKVIWVLLLFVGLKITMDIFFYKIFDANEIAAKIE